MRKIHPVVRQVASLTVLAGVGMAALRTPWAWSAVLAVVVVVAVVLMVTARNALGRASRRIATILEDELSSDEEAPSHPERLAS